MPHPSTAEQLQEPLNLACTILCAVSLVLCALVLVLAGWIYTVKAARPHIRRVSFRLMLWALSAQLVYDIIRTCLYSDGTLSTVIYGHSVGCATAITLFFQALTTVNCLITCIALNLMLITCFGVNPIERGLEKWYVGGSLVFGLGLPVVPAALGHFGPDPLYEMCYLTLSDPDTRLTVVVAEFALWQLMSCLVATISVAMAIFTLVRQTRATRRAMRASPMLNLFGEDSPVESSPAHILATSGSTAPLVRESCRDKRNRLLRRLGVDRGDQVENGQLQDKVFGIAMRISLYPISLIAVNSIVSVADIRFTYSMRDGINTDGEVVLYVLYYLLYAGRGIVFALSCLLFDPCLKRGLATAWSVSFPRKSDKGRSPYLKDGVLPTALAVPHSSFPSPLYAFGQPDSDIPKIAYPDDTKSGPDSKSGSQLSLHAFMSSSLLRRSFAVPETRRPTANSLDITAALNKLSYYPETLPVAPPASHGGLRGRTERSGDEQGRGRSSRKDGSSNLKSHAYTRSFVGVTSESLPAEMTDDVDVDLRLSYTPAGPSRYAANRRGSSSTTASAAAAGYSSSRWYSTERPDHKNTGTGEGHVKNDVKVEGEDDVGPRLGEGIDAIMLEPIIFTPRPSLTPPDSLHRAESSSKSVECGPLSPSKRDRPTKSGRAVKQEKSGEVASPEPRKISWGTIPTAPTPQRILDRRARIAAAEDRQSREEEEERAKRIEKLTDQL